MNKYELRIMAMFLLTTFALNWGLFGDVEVMLVFSLPMCLLQIISWIIVSRKDFGNGR